MKGFLAQLFSDLPKTLDNASERIGISLNIIDFGDTSVRTPLGHLQKTV